MVTQTVTPVWKEGTTGNTSPLGLTPIVSCLISSKKKGVICGFWIANGAPESFSIEWIHDSERRVRTVGLGASGTVFEEFNVPLNQGLLADSGTEVSISPLIGASGECSLLIAEVDV